MKIAPATRVVFWLHRHGWPAAAGLLLLAAVWPLAHFGADATRARVLALRQAQSAQRELPARKPDPKADLVARQAAFEAGLPSAAASSQALRHIHRSAAEHDVLLSNGEYRLVSEPGGRLLRYQITLPAQGTYPDLRAWMADTLNELPTIALDEVSFKRDTVGDPQLQARLRWSFYFKAP